MERKFGWHHVISTVSLFIFEMLTCSRGRFNDLKLFYLTRWNVTVKCECNASVVFIFVLFQRSFLMTCHSICCVNVSCLICADVDCEAWQQPVVSDGTYCVFIHQYLISMVVSSSRNTASERKRGDSFRQSMVATRRTENCVKTI